MDIFYIQSCIWPKTPIFDLRASSGRRANASVEISNFFIFIGTQRSKVIRKNQWKNPFLLKKCLKNQIFWIFRFSKLQISMKISTHFWTFASLLVTKTMLWVIGFGPKLTQTGPNSTQISVRYDEIPTKTFLASPGLCLF